MGGDMVTFGVITILVSFVGLIWWFVELRDVKKWREGYEAIASMRFTAGSRLRHERDVLRKANEALHGDVKKWREGYEAIMRFTAGSTGYCVKVSDDQK